MLQFEEAAQSALILKTNVDYCLETKDAFIFWSKKDYSNENDETLVYEKKDGLMHSLGEYYHIPFDEVKTKLVEFSSLPATPIRLKYGQRLQLIKE